MRSVRIAANRLYDRLCDARAGISTGGRGCSPTPYRLVHRAFAALPLAADDHLIDFGAGRGRIVCYAARLPVARVSGVEIEPRFVAEAQANIRAMRGCRAGAVSVSEGSAADFDCTGGTIFYFANPFGDAIFSAVLANIHRSLVASPRAARIVYFHPTCKTLLDDANWLEPARVVHADRTGQPSVLIYDTRASAFGAVARAGDLAA